MKAHDFRGRRWRLVDTGTHADRGQGGGICEGPHIKNRQMLLPMSGDTLHDLDTCIHEALHACFWDVDEEGIHESAADIARLLWRLGWRREC